MHANFRVNHTGVHCMSTFETRTQCTNSIYNNIQFKQGRSIKLYNITKAQLIALTVLKITCRNICEFCGALDKTSQALFNLGGGEGEGGNEILSENL